MGNPGRAEYVDGCTLESWQRQPDRTWEEILAMYLAAGQGLLAAHRVGLIHRDFKPDNVLVGSDQRPRVADFGLARAQGHSEPVSPEPPPVSPSSPSRMLAASLTAAGALAGTPAYMSPEQYRSDPLDSRTDQFSFCAALYEALYRQLPFAGKELADLAGEILLGRVRAVPKESPVPPLIAEVLRRGMALDAEQRFPSMEELLQALILDPQHDPAGAPRPRRRFSVIVLLAIAVLVLGLVTRDKNQTATGVELLTVAGFMMGVLLGAGFWLRRSLRQNSYHRGMARMILLCATQLFLVRLVALLAGMTVPQTLAMDFASLLAVGALLVRDYTPAAWPVPIGCIVLSILSARYPHLALPLGSVFLPACAATILFAWNRAVRRRAERKARKDPSPPGPSASRPGPSSGE